MNYQHLRYFQVVARSPSYQQAADKLFVTQPTLSRAIASLEDELGIELFEKFGRSVKLTTYGTAFLEYVETALDALDRGVSEVHNMKGQVEGTLTIASVYGYTYRYLPAMISQFGKVYPNVRFELTQMPSQSAIYQVHQGNVDMGIHLASSFMEKYPDLEYHCMQENEIVVVVSKSHPLAGRMSCALAAIADGPLVSFDRTSGIFYKTVEMFKQAGLAFSSSLQVSDDQSVLNLVRNGMGAACVLRNVGEDDDGVVTLTIEDHVDNNIPAYIAIRKKGCHSGIVRAFLNFVLQNTESTRRPN